MSDHDRRELVFIGDVHLDADDPHLPAFLRFLDGLGRRASRIVFLGDLFNLWIGQRELERPHQAAVVAKLAELRARGIVVRYVEGNRDYRIERGYAGHAVDEATLRGVAEDYGGRRLWAVHGDLANLADRQYRAWRRISRSAVFWGLINLLPGPRRLRMAESLEARMRSSNVEFKQDFPEAAVREYAGRFLTEGWDAVVLGHFHVEQDLRSRPSTEVGNEGRILVLPEWRQSRRHLRVTADGVIEFVDSEV